MAIRLIEIENKLINDRLTVFLATKGGLVAGLTFILSQFKDTPIRQCVIILVFSVVGSMLVGDSQPSVLIGGAGADDPREGASALGEIAVGRAQRVAIAQAAYGRGGVRVNASYSHPRATVRQNYHLFFDTQID
jgi:hypothetical protein